MLDAEREARLHQELEGAKVENQRLEAEVQRLNTVYDQLQSQSSEATERLQEELEIAEAAREGAQKDALVIRETAELEKLRAVT